MTGRPIGDAAAPYYQGMASPSCPSPLLMACLSAAVHCRGKSGTPGSGRLTTHSLPIAYVGATRGCCRAGQPRPWCCFSIAFVATGPAPAGFIPLSEQALGDLS